MEEETEPYLTDEKLKRYENLLPDLFDTIFSSLESFEKERKKNRAYLERSYQHVGKIISCHLVIESLINTELLVLTKISPEKLEKGKSTFSEKLGLLPTTGKPYCFFLSDIQQLNEIRNQFAHNLEAEITNEQIGEFDFYLKIFKKELRLNEISIEERIEEFTSICIAIFSLRNPNSLKLWQLFIDKYPIEQLNIDYNKLYKNVDEYNVEIRGEL